MSRETLVLLPWLLACSPEAPTDTEPLVAAVAEFGFEDTRVFTSIVTADDGLDVPRDLEFHPDRSGELWVINRATDGMLIVFGPGESGQSAEFRRDAFGNHFMEEPSSLAFGAENTFASCQESLNTYNGQTSGDQFMGPALWPADLEVFAEINQRNHLLGSHLDMLHQSPLCMGIAHDHDNVYWVFDGFNGDVVYYDFQDDHGYGHDDHADGIVRRYPDAAVTYEEGVPSHLVLDDESGWLYVADTGAGQILRVDTASGVKGRSLRAQNEPLAEYSEMEDATVETFATGLNGPSGIAIQDGRLFVSDYFENQIVAYDLVSGAELDRIDVDAEGIMGITFGPDGLLYYADGDGDEVFRLDPGAL